MLKMSHIYKKTHLEKKLPKQKKKILSDWGSQVVLFFSGKKKKKFNFVINKHFLIFFKFFNFISYLPFYGAKELVLFVQKQRYFSFKQVQCKILTSLYMNINCFKNVFDTFKHLWLNMEMVEEFVLSLILFLNVSCQGN